MNEIPSWLQGSGLLCVMLMAVKSAWPIASRAIEQRRVERNRASLAQAGLTPEQYMATISPTDYQSYSEAVQMFWPRRDRSERRDATLDRLGHALGPLAQADIRTAKEVANRLNGRS